MSRYLLIALTLGAALVLSDTNRADDKEAKFSAKCPVSGKAAKKESAVAFKGGKVYFCCDNCPAAFKKDRKKFVVKANHQLVVTGQAEQVKCPIAGRKLNPETAITIAGAEVAFCCNNCKGKASKAEGDDQLALVFSNAAFKKGFEVKNAKKGKKAKKADQEK